MLGTGRTDGCVSFTFSMLLLYNMHASYIILAAICYICGILSKTGRNRLWSYENVKRYYYKVNYSTLACNVHYGRKNCPFGLLLRLRISQLSLVHIERR